MSLVSNSAPSGLRIYEPTIIAGCPQPEELFDCTAHVRHKIRSAYRKARELLKVRGGGERRSLCIGLLDPASNLVINSLISRGRKRKRDRDREPSRAREVVEEDLERRSLDGMVAFLTRLFPDLADSQAVRYLFLADGDALVAAGIIVSDVGMKRFYESAGSVAMEMALLRCAALAYTAATPKSPRVGEVPTLFFAEISYGYEDTSFCYPLPLPLPCAAQNRCLQCEFMGIRIVHPVGIDFHGGESDFEKLACRKYPYDDDFYRMDIIHHRFSMADDIYGSVKEDRLYDDLDGHKTKERDLSSMSIDAQMLLLTNN